LRDNGILLVCEGRGMFVGYGCEERGICLAYGCEERGVFIRYGCKEQGMFVDYGFVHGYTRNFILIKI
jgi:hypothetical protein